MPDLPSPDDILCEFCGYTLNGLPPSGRCPECGELIAASTTESSRILPAWESVERPGVAAFLRTTGSLLAGSRRFFRNLRLKVEHDRTASFAQWHILIATVIAGITMHVHYDITRLRLVQINPWLATLLRMGAAWVVLQITLRLVVILASWEGAWWGYRLPQTHVSRAIRYASAGLLPATLVCLAVTVTFKSMMSYDAQFGLYFLPYLIVLSAAVVLGGLYLFRIFMTAMWSIRFGNV